MASVSLTPSARLEFDELPIVVRGRVAKVLERLESWPNVSGAKPLRGGLAGRYRMRTGDYRVQFYPTGDVVTVEKIGHRDGFYDD
jgi:mRNA-degrading endonuclease RelE of RelBE toxin-antitoxin system